LRKAITDNLDEIMAAVNRMSEKEKENLIKLLEQIEEHGKREEARHRTHIELNRAVGRWRDRAVDTDS
jgi:hypothetical protein